MPNLPKLTQYNVTCTNSNRLKLFKNFYFYIFIFKIKNFVRVHNYEIRKNDGAFDLFCKNKYDDSESKCTFRFFPKLKKKTV